MAYRFIYLCMGLCGCAQPRKTLERIEVVVVYGSVLLFIDLCSCVLVCVFVYRSV